MEDPVLNRNLQEIKELQTRWNQFHDFVNMAMQQGPAKITPQAEFKFLELKSRIAMLHDGFIGGSKQHDAKTAQNIIQIVADAILLKKVANSSPAERQKFEFDWNECFMLLNDTVSSQEDEKKRLAAINERSYRMAQRREMLRAKFHNFLHHPAFKWSIVMLVFLGATFGVQESGVYDFRHLYSNPPIPMTKTIYKNVVGYVVRPLLAKDLEYMDLDEVIINEQAALPQGVSAMAANITPAIFKSAVLGQMGVSASLGEAGKLVDARIGFGVEQVNIQGKVISIIAVLFKTTPDAQKFIDLVKADLGNQSADEKNRILSRTRAVRKANLVVIGIGDHALHTGRLEEKWKTGSGVNDLG